MNIQDFKAGTNKKGNGYSYFLPEKINHPFSWDDGRIDQLLEQAALKLGELNSFSRLVPDTGLFIQMHVTKEAVVSSKIEGTRTDMEEALQDEIEIKPERRDDWQEVGNYIRAMNQAIEELETLPLSQRLIKNTHETLLASGRGEHKMPGAFRQSQNWLGGNSLQEAEFIPPAHVELPDLLFDFESFLNNKEIQIPKLIKIAIAHYQFETIHPFLDGNGRVGRLLITLDLVANKVLNEPLLYLSSFIVNNKTAYYDNLTFVRTKNDLARWIKFFLTGIVQTAEKSAATLHKIIALKADIESRHIMTMGKRSQNGMRVLNKLFENPFITAKDVQKQTDLSAKAANDLIQIFVDKQILQERTGNRRNRKFMFKTYIECFKE